MVCERKFSDTLHGIGMKLDILSYHDVEMCISFFYNEPQFFPKVMALYDLEFSKRGKGRDICLSLLKQPTPSYCIIFS